MNVWEALPPIIIFAVFALAFRWYLDYRMKQKLIEKGLIGEQAKMLERDYLSRFPMSSLKWGMILTFVGIAVIVVQSLPRYTEDEVIFGIIVLAAGVALLLYYFIADRLQSKYRRDHPNGDKTS